MSTPIEITCVKLLNAASEHDPMAILAAIIGSDLESGSKEVLIAHSRDIADRIKGEVDEAFYAVATRCLMAEVMESVHDHAVARSIASQKKRLATIAKRKATK